LDTSSPQKQPAKQVKAFYNPPTLIFKQALSLACHGWLTGWAGFPAWMLKGKKVLRTAAGATAIGCTGYPYHVVWEVTTRCNLDCIHCYASSVDSAQAELSTAEGKRFLDQVAAAGDIRMIVITGGEPLLRKDIFELVEYAGKLGLSIIFSTNGTLLTPDMAKDLARLGVANFSISLDGYTEGCHEAIRRRPGCFQKTIDGLKAAAQTDACVQVNFTAMRENLAELPGIIDFAESLNSDIIMVFQAIPPRQERGAHELDAEQQMYLMKTIAEKQKKTRALIMPVCCPEYWPMLLESRLITPVRSIQNKVFTGCGAGSGFSYVRFDGDVWPCNFIPIPAGSVRQTSFTDIWKNAPLLQEFRGPARNIKGVCGGCDYEKLCGGCRGRAFAHTADHHAADPACLLKKT
jgi:radical SAM protein with 4Fe4S-binding SPASM domain